MELVCASADCIRIMYEAARVETAPHPPSPPAAPVLLRRLDVVDDAFAVLLSGTSPADLREAPGTRLPAAVEAEVRDVVASHDFGQIAFATALVGTDLALRISRTVGMAGCFYNVLMERTTLRRDLGRVARAHGLDLADVELLRLIAGGYGIHAIGARIGHAASAVRDRIDRLQERLGCTTRRELLALVAGDPTARRAERTIRRSAG